MTPSYASVSDLQAGWRTLSQNEQAIADVLLERASALLFQEIKGAVLDENQTEVAKYIVCDMVRYSFLQNSLGNVPALEDGISGLTWEHEGEGGSLMVTDRHMRMLGMSRSRAGFSVSS